MNTLRKITTASAAGIMALGFMGGAAAPAMAANTDTSTVAKSSTAVDQTGLKIDNTDGNKINFSFNADSGFTTSVDNATGDLIILQNDEEVQRVPTFLSGDGKQVSGNWTSDGQNFTFAAVTATSAPTDAAGAPMAMAASTSDCVIKNVRNTTLTGLAGGIYGGVAGATIGGVAGAVAGGIISAADC